MPKADNKIMNSTCSLPDDFRKSVNEHAEDELKVFDHSWISQNFTAYSPRQQIARFILRERVFSRTKNIQGAIAEMGVFSGFGFFSWLQLRSVFCPLDNQKKILGFDTFQGFAEINPKDKNEVIVHKKGDYTYSAYDHLKSLIDVHAKNSYLPNNAKNAELIRGSVMKTLPEYIKKNPHTLFSLVYIDFDLYEPTKFTVETILPRMSSGGIIVFDQVNIPEYPGETLAMLESLDIRKHKIERFDFDTKICFVQV